MPLFYLYPYVQKSVLGLLIFSVSFLLGKGLIYAIAKLLKPQINEQQALFLEKLLSVVLWASILAFLLDFFGFDLKLFLGAAGIVTVALGFASQTSASNFISGLFLIGEKPFSIGDVIRIDQTTGEVVSIDLLSVKLRTFDNLLVRVPNEQMFKSQITNLTHYPIRRLDIYLHFSYQEDLSRVQTILMQVAGESPICLDEPRPLFIFLGFEDSYLKVQFSVWAATTNFIDLRNGIQANIQQHLQANQVEIPYPSSNVFVHSKEKIP